MRLFRKRPPAAPADATARAEVQARPLHLNPDIASGNARAAARLVIVEEQIARWEAMERGHPKATHRDRKLKEFRNERSRLRGKLGLEG